MYNAIRKPDCDVLALTKTYNILVLPCFVFVSKRAVVEPDAAQNPSGGDRHARERAAISQFQRIIHPSAAKPSIPVHEQFLEKHFNADYPQAVSKLGYSEFNRWTQHFPEVYPLGFGIPTFFLVVGLIFWPRC